MFVRSLQFSHSGAHQFDLGGGSTLKLIRKLGNQARMASLTLAF
jgi:hypothetical protein